MWMSEVCKVLLRKLRLGESDTLRVASSLCSKHVFRCCH
jgi:hypothetical protein